MSEQKPTDRLTEDHVEWVIDGQKRSIRIRTTFRFLFRVIGWIIDALKWVADSLKWAVPLFLSALAAYQTGALDALKEYFG